MTPPWIIYDATQTPPHYECIPCGATVPDTSKYYNRFVKRHGVNCKQAERKAFTAQLASGTRSVDADGWMEESGEWREGSL